MLSEVSTIGFFFNRGLAFFNIMMELCLSILWNLYVFFFFQVENHDDFVTTEEGRVHIQDQRGYYVLYDSALGDFK